MKFNGKYLKLSKCIYCGLTHISGRPCALPTLRVNEPLIRRRETTLDQLARLDSQWRPGLLEADFMKLFAKCRCGLVMTRRVFRNHFCAAAPAPVVQVIDLTSDSSAEGPIIIDLTGDSDDD
jgi:hypothetical protein